MSDNFPMYKLTGAGCEHHALLRSYTPPYADWAGGSEEAAYDSVRKVHEQLRERLERHLGCPGGHDWEYLGEAIPLGEELCEGNSVLEGLPLWVAGTEEPECFVVGTAPSREAFWERVAGVSVELDLQPLYPAARRHVHFVADEDLDHAISRALDLCRMGLWPV